MLEWLFGRKKTPEELAFEARRARTLASLEAGGIPVEAKERIEREVALGHDFFVSDLSAPEFLLAKECGVQAIGQVMGTSFYNVSWYGMSQRSRRVTGEMVDFSKAHLEARNLAVSRLQQEAALLGASGVVGVRIKTNNHAWSQRQTEFTAVGTAVRIPGWQGKPFVSALDAQEFWALYKAGWIPTGIAFGVCSYYMYTDPDTRALIYGFWGNGRSNAEVQLYTQGLQFTREKAMANLSADIKAHEAEGVVGMDIDFNMEHIEYESGSSTYHDLIAHFIAFGTTVKYAPELVAEETTHPRPLMMIDLSSKPAGRHGVTHIGSMEQSHTKGNSLGHRRY